MPDLVVQAKDGVILKWGIGYTLPGYIVHSHEEETTAQSVESPDEYGSLVEKTWFDYRKSIKVGGLIKDATILPKPGDTVAIDEVPYWVEKSTLQRANTEKAKFTLELSRAIDNNFPHPLT